MPQKEGFKAFALLQVAWDYCLPVAYEGVWGVYEVGCGLWHALLPSVVPLHSEADTAQVLYFV